MNKDAYSALSHLNIIGVGVPNMEWISQLLAAKVISNAMILKNNT